MSNVMQLHLSKEPRFSLKSGKITLSVTAKNLLNRRVENLYDCLVSHGFHHRIHIVVSSDGKTVQLEPDNGEKHISGCDELESVLEVCGFRLIKDYEVAKA